MDVRGPLRKEVGVNRPFLAMRVGCSILRCLAATVFSGFKIRFRSAKVLLHGSSSLRVDGGRISLGSFQIERNVEMIAVDGGEIAIGDKLFLNSNSRMVSMARIEIGVDCLVGDSVSIYDHDHVSDDLDTPISKQGFKKAPVTIGDHVWIGSHVVICKGVTIGSHSIVAAGAVVVRSLPPNCVAAGIPAKVVKMRSPL